MTRKVGFSLKLPPDLKSQWVSHCREHGQSPSDAVRRIIHHLLHKNVGDHLSDVESEVPDRIRRRIEFRLSESEFAAVVRISEQSGTSVNKWIADLVRAYITHEPQFGMHELQAVGESNHQLRAIGRNLNQVALAMNRGGKSGDFSGDIRRLSAMLNEHTEKVNAVIRSNLERWRVTWR